MEVFAKNLPTPFTTRLGMGQKNNQGGFPPSTN
jgi:hypothetical protein